MSVDENMDVEFVEEKGKWADQQEEDEPVEKTRVCKYVVTRRGCDKGDACTFIHPVCAFFASEQGCTAGDKCQFQHDKNNLPVAALKNCPNKGCQSLCLGKQCMKCHALMIKENRSSSPRRKPERHSERSERSERSGRNERTERTEYRRTDSPRRTKSRRSSRSPVRSSRRNSRSPERRRRRDDDGMEQRSRRDTTSRLIRVRVCPEPGCRNTCLGRRCRECHFRQFPNDRPRNAANTEQPATEYRSDDGGYHDNKEQS